MRRGIAQSYIFLIVLGAVITLLLLYFGWGAIQDMNERARQNQLIQFSVDIKYSVDAAFSRLGSVKYQTYSVPDGVSHICFANIYMKDELYGRQELDPLVRNGIEVDHNMFLFGQGFTYGYNIGPLIVPDPYYRCFEIQNGKLVIGLEGAGNSAVLR